MNIVTQEIWNCVTSAISFYKIYEPVSLISIKSHMQADFKSAGNV